MVATLYASASNATSVEHYQCSSIIMYSNKSNKSIGDHTLGLSFIRHKGSLCFRLPELVWFRLPVFDSPVDGMLRCGAVNSTW